MNDQDPALTRIRGLPGGAADLEAKACIAGWDDAGQRPAPWPGSGSLALADSRPGGTGAQVRGWPGLDWQQDRRRGQETGFRGLGASRVALERNCSVCANVRAGWQDSRRVRRTAKGRTRRRAISERGPFGKRHARRDVQSVPSGSHLLFQTDHTGRKNRKFCNSRQSK